jgi:hypothetical protein
MPAAPRILTGNLTDIGAAPASGVGVTFSRQGVSAQYGDVVIPQNVRTVTTSGGAISQQLYPGTYRGRVQMNNGPAVFTFTLAEDGPTDLAELLEEREIETTAQIVLDTRAARDAAIEAKDDAIAAVAAVPLLRDAFSTVQDLLADTTLTYANTVENQVIPAGGFRYRRAASTATDHHVTTAGGVKLYVLPGADGNRSLAASGADITGATDCSARLAALWELGPVLIDGGFLISASISQTAAHNLVFAQGAQITVASGQTLTVRGQIVAGDAPIFYGAGTVNLNEGPRWFNIGWFDGADLSEKWDFCRRGFLDLYWYNIYLPQPSVIDRAADFDMSGGQRRHYWKLAAPLEFSDPENRSTIMLNGQIKATASMTDMLIFSPDSLKTEDIEFIGRTELIGNSNVTNSGVLYRGAARVNFNHLNINQVPWGVDFDTILPISYCDIRYLYVGAASLGAVRFSKNTNGVSQINIGALRGAQFSGVVACMLEVNGDCRDINVGSISYLTDGGSDLQHIIRLTGDATGRPRWITVGHTYANNAEVGLYTRLSSGSSRMEGINVGPLTTNITTSGKLAFDVEWLYNSNLIGANRIDAASLGLNCLRVNLIGTYSAVTRGTISYCMINGVLSQPLAANALPDVDNVLLGETVYDSTSSRGGAWHRVAATGTAATDFIPVGRHIVGTGSPEGVVTATIGNIFSRMDGGASTTLYVKESGSGNTGWVAK